MCKSCINNIHHGRFELIVGCMFAGKTEEFFRRLRRLQYAKLDIIVFKPLVDTRTLKKDVISHNKNYMNCEIIKHPKEIKLYLEKNPHIRVVGIDEVQFFGEAIVSIIDELVKKRYIVLANGLDLDFQAVPFNTTMQLFPVADFITKLHAICICCGAYANRTQRVINGEPSSASGPRILIGAEETYEARCRRCYILKK